MPVGRMWLMNRASAGLNGVPSVNRMPVNSVPKQDENFPYRVLTYQTAHQGRSPVFTQCLIHARTILAQMGRITLTCCFLYPSFSSSLSISSDVDFDGVSDTARLLLMVLNSHYGVRPFLIHHTLGIYHELSFQS